MTFEEIRAYLTDSIKSAEDTRQRFEGMTLQMCKAEVNAFLSGSIASFVKIGALTKRQGAELFTELFRI